MISLLKSTDDKKKWMVVIKSKNGNKTIHFGAAGYDDFTIHKDVKRKNNYINRHKTNEDWSKKGILTPGFWSRWILWNKNSIQKSVRDVNRKFNLNVSYK